MFDEAVITNVGKNLLARWIQGETLEIAEAAVGTGVVSPVSLMAQTNLVDRRNTVSIIRYQPVESGIRLQLQLTSLGIITGYTLNQIGIWGKVGADTALLAIFQDPVGVQVPTEAEMVDYVFTFYATLQCSNEGNLTVTIDTDAFVTHGDLQRALSELEEDGVSGPTINRFGVCSTAALTSSKTVSITDGTFSLKAGSRVTVLFENANSADSPTLAVNDSEAKNIFFHGVQITSGVEKALLCGAVDFVYDGTQFHLVGSYKGHNHVFADLSDVSIMTAQELIDLLDTEDEEED